MRDRMSVKNRVMLLRISFWIGAILDGIYAINMSLVWLIESYEGIDPMKLVRFVGGLQSRYIWGIATIFMISWTILLIWADRKPLERRDVILITSFPLITGLLVDTFFAISVNLVSWVDILLVQSVYICLIVLFAASYLLTREISEG
jgi:hypothetical protein